MQFKLSPARNGQAYFEIQASGNHATLATSETYKDPADALAAISLIQKEASSATVVDNT